MIKNAILTTAVFLLVSIGVCLAFPPVYTGKIRGTPDLCQADRAARLPNGGKGFCAPVAVSNSLVWLARNGYLDLIPKIGDRRMNQPQLATLLGKPAYMDTSDFLGTSPTDLMTGISRFLHDRGYEYEYLGYQGWRDVPERWSGHSDIPNLDWIRDGLVGDTAVWLNLGWYAYDPMTETYERTGGHWVTLVGYGLDSKGKPNPDIFIIHDPATKISRLRRKPGNEPERPAGRLAQPSPMTAPACPLPSTSQVSKAGRPVPPRLVRHDFVRIAPMTHGILISRELKMERSAAGFFRVTGITSLEKEADIAILDGAVVLRMKTSQKVLRRPPPQEPQEPEEPPPPPAQSP